jgi:hypothetical protein
MVRKSKKKKATWKIQAALNHQFKSPMAVHFGVSPSSFEDQIYENSLPKFSSKG